MSGEDEYIHAYMRVDANRLGTYFFITSSVLTITALYLSALPHYIDEAYSTNRTKHAIENYKSWPNGSLYYEFTEEDGSLSYGELGPWFDRLLIGDYRYSFGNSFWNYCKLRTVPRVEWVSSIFRSMNHLVLVQVLFRSAVLLTMTHSIFQCLLIRNVLKTRTKGVQRLIGLPSILVETVHNLAIFTVCCLQNDQDAHLIQISRYAVYLVTLTTVLKLLISAIISSNTYIQLSCILISFLVMLSHNTVLEDFDSFIKDPYCDSMTYPSVVISQLIYFFAFFICGYLQNNALKQIHIITSCVQEEIDYQRRFCVGYDNQ